jgi:hypothetical protein
LIVSSGASTSPLLHRLIVDIKTLELELDCQVEVVHVPGTAMIAQGTDGLSRGVWVTPLHDPVNQKSLLAEVFAPIPFNATLGACATCDKVAEIGVIAYSNDYMQKQHIQ